MTTVDLTEPAVPSFRSVRYLTVGLGMGLLLARPFLASRFGWSPLTVSAVFTSVFILAATTPVAGQVRAVGSPSRLAGLSVLGGGAGVFLVGRLAEGGHSPGRPTVTVIALSSLAALAEEALFRRVAYSELAVTGPAVAIAGSAAMFGLAHATVYGWWAVPLDTAAGCVLGWQRWASGSWAVPAVTHVLADLLVVI